MARTLGVALILMALYAVALYAVMTTAANARPDAPLRASSTGSDPATLVEQRYEADHQMYEVDASCKQNRCEFAGANVNVGAFSDCTVRGEATVSGSHVRFLWVSDHCVWAGGFM